MFMFLLLVSARQAEGLPCYWQCHPFTDGTDAADRLNPLIMRR